MVYSRGRYNRTGPYGLGERNDNAQRVINFCKIHNLFATNTWFQQRRSAQHTWVSPNGLMKNQIDYVLVDKRYINSMHNSKSMPGADCGSDHNPVLATMRIKLQSVRRAKKKAKWNVNNLKKPEIRKEYRVRLDKQIQEQNIDKGTEIDEIWRKLSECIEVTCS